MFKVGDKIRVERNLTPMMGLRNPYVGQTGEIESEHKVLGKPMYGIKFDNPIYQQENVDIGIILWFGNELMMVEGKTEKDAVSKPENIPDYEVLYEGDNKIIISYPAIIYIITRGNKVFKGVVRLQDGDVWNREEGINMARLKAEIKLYEYGLKQYNKETKSILRNRRVYAEGVEKDIEYKKNRLESIINPKKVRENE